MESYNKQDKYRRQTAHPRICCAAPLFWRKTNTTSTNLESLIGDVGNIQSKSGEPFYNVDRELTYAHPYLNEKLFLTPWWDINPPSVLANFHSRIDPIAEWRFGACRFSSCGTMSQLWKAWRKGRGKEITQLVGWVGGLVGSESQND